MPEFGNEDQNPREDAANVHSTIAHLERQLSQTRGIANELLVSMISLIDTVCPEFKQDLMDALSEPARKFAAKVLGKERAYARRRYEKELEEYKKALRVYQEMSPALRKSLRVGLPVKPRKPKILRKPK